jgi:hypothetical protein
VLSYVRIRKLRHLAISVDLFSMSAQDGHVPAGLANQCFDGDSFAFLQDGASQT